MSSDGESGQPVAAGGSAPRPSPRKLAGWVALTFLAAWGLGDLVRTSLLAWRALQPPAARQRPAPVPAGIPTIVSPQDKAGSSPVRPQEPMVVPARVEPLQGQPLLDALREGGLILYFRHFHTDHRTWHSDPIRPRHHEMSIADFQASCEQQRPLIPYGVMRAEHVGRTMEKLGVRLGRVLTSPYCRTIQGARLLAGREPEITLDLLHYGGKRSFAEMQKGLLKLLAQPVAPGSNTLLMGHRPQMDEIAVIREGQCFVLRPLPGGGFVLIGAINDTDWLEALSDVRYLGARAFYAEAADQVPDWVKRW